VSCFEPRNGCPYFVLSQSVEGSKGAVATAETALAVLEAHLAVLKAHLAVLEAHLAESVCLDNARQHLELQRSATLACRWKMSASVMI